MSRQIAVGEAVANAAPRYTPEHDSLTWLVRTGHLHGPKKASTRYLDSGDVRKSVAVGGAQCILNYMEDDKLLKLLRSESEETRKGGVHSLQQEMEDQIAGDVDQGLS